MLKINSTFTLNKVSKLSFLSISILLCSCKVSSLYICDCPEKDHKIRIDYFPSQKANVSDEDYKRGISLLDDIYSDYKIKQAGKRNEGSRATPLNLGIAFTYLKESKDKILCMIKWADESDIEGTANLFIVQYIDPSSFNLTQSEYDSLIKRYKPIYEKYLLTQRTSESALAKNAFDQELVQFMTALVGLDQQYRSEGIDYYMENVKLQTEIDSLNMLKVDSLYEKYGKYIGKTLVGESKEYAMWTVIQHAPLSKQKEYLPIVQEAVQEFELKQGPFKMLIDRVYYQKYGYQIFGTQSGLELGTDKQIKKAKKQFSID